MARIELLNQIKLFNAGPKKQPLKEAALELGINYSIANTIIRIWRKENRVIKKYSYTNKRKKK